MKTKIYKGLLIPFLFLLFVVQSYGQEPVFGRADFIHGEGFDKVSDIHIDKLDNLYITGTFEKGGSIGAISVKQAGENTMFVAKYNKDGYIQYSKQFGGSGRISVHSITTDIEDNLYLTGSFRKSCKIGEETLTASHFQDNFITKLSPDGNFLWVKQFQADTKEDKQLLLCDKDDNLILAGSFYKNLQIDNKTIASSRGSDIYFAVFDKLGKLQQLIHFEGQGNDQLKDMTLSEDNRLFFSGSFSETLNLDGNYLKTNGRNDVFWAELNLDFTDPKQIKQVKQIGGRFDDEANRIMLANDVIYLTGSFQDKLTFKKGDILSKGGKDVFVAQYKLNGKEIDAVGIGGKGNDYPHSVVINSKGELYIIGNYRGNIETEAKTIETKEYQSDNFVAKLDADGKLKNIFSFGGEDNDFPVDAAISKNNTIYLTGSFRIDFIFGETKSKLTDKNNIFLVEWFDCENAVLDLGPDLDLCGESLTLSSKEDHKTYLWSNGSKNKETAVETSGNYELTVTDKYGCSAKDDIYVTIHPIPSVDLGEDLTLTKGEVLNLSVPSGYNEYLWNGNKGSESLLIETKDKEPGEYAFELQITDNNGCICSDQIKITVKESDKDAFNANDLNVTITPNPSDGRFTLTITNADPKNELITEIYTPDGRLIKHKKIEQTDNVIIDKVNIQKQAKGDYILKITNGTKIKNQVLIITDK